MTTDSWDRGLGGEPSPLLQGWAWGEVQSRSGWAVERVDLPSGHKVSILSRKLGPFRSAYVPRGPVPATHASLEELAVWARNRGLVRLRVDPEEGPELAGTLTSLGFREGPEIQPKHTLVVPLGDDQVMLDSFKPKTRYNIRLAAKRGVEVQEGQDAAELERQTIATAARQGISLASRLYYELLLEGLDWCRTYVARIDGEAVAAILVARFDGRAYYLYGGSNGRHRQAMPAYAAQWEAMRSAARAGCRDYDLWGVAPPDCPDHPWAGLNQFKEGFGGRAVSYVGSWDLVIDPLGNSCLRSLENARRLVREVKRTMIRA